MTNFTKEFFARVFPWSENEPGYLNIHWTSSAYKGVPGRAVTSVDGAVSTIDWLKGIANIKDIYFCTSAQGEYDTTKSKPGDHYKSAKRSTDQALRLKALFLDLDAKGIDKNSYPDQNSAITALVKFLADTGLPPPNLIVNSGGGFHVYWTMSRSLSRPEWQPLADALAEATRQLGLKIDTACTVDACRILRVPGTLNHKTTPPKPVSVLRPMRDDYSVERITASLARFIGVSSTVVVALPHMVTGYTPSSALLLNADLSAGTSKVVGPIDAEGVKRVVRGCAFLRDTIITHGAKNANPLWHQSLLMAAFMEGGEKIARGLSDGHPSYTQGETDQQFLRVASDIANKGLGWPSCKAIANAGCSSCASCVHFAKGKSPLNLSFGVTPAQPIGAPTAALGGPAPGSTAQPAPASPGAAMAAATADWDLPPGYKRRADNMILKASQMMDGSWMDLPVGERPMYNPELQSGPWTLSFSTDYGKAQTRITIPSSEVGSMGFKGLLQGQGFMVMPKSLPGVTEFMTSWITQLQNTKASIVNTTPYGWSLSGVTSNIRGFNYGGILYGVDGTETMSPHIDPVMGRNYTPRGNRQVWLDCCKLITDQKRPALEAIVAASFAAPLVKMLNRPGLLFSAYSPDSGIGKSTAMAVGMAVWSSPNRTKTTTSDTENSLFRKLANVHHLPVFFDENKSDDPKKFIDQLFRLSEGLDRNRLKRDLTMVEPGTWNTLLISAGNNPLADLINSGTASPEASHYRLFEVRVPKQPFVFDMTEAQRMTGSLDDNYGFIGAEYAKFLSMNHKMVLDETIAFTQQTALDMKIDGSAMGERNWLSVISLILLGAKYANTLVATQFDLVALKAYFMEALGEQRTEVARATVNVNNPNHVSDLLQRFIATMQVRHTIYTNKVWQLPGRPTMGLITLIKPTDNLQAVVMQISRDDKIMRISAEKLDTWMAERRIPRKVFIGALEKEFGMVRKMGHLGGGTGLSTVQQYVYDIVITGALESMLDGL